MLCQWEGYEPDGLDGEFEDTVPVFEGGDFGAFVSLFEGVVAGASDFVAGVASDDDPGAAFEFSARLSLR